MVFPRQSGRALVLRFLQQPYSRKVAIAQRLGLLASFKDDLSDLETFTQVFILARERVLLEQLAAELDHYGRGGTGDEVRGAAEASEA